MSGRQRPGSAALITICDRAGRGRRGVGRRRLGATLCTLVAAAFLILLAGGAGAGAQAPVEMQAVLDRETATVGDRIQVTVTVTLPADAQADLTTLEAQFGDLELLLVGLPQDTLLADGRREVKATYEVAAYRTGVTQLPALNLAVRLPDLTTVTAATQPVPIAIESVIPTDQTPTDVRDLKPQISFPLVSGISTRQVALIVAAVALAISALALLVRRLRRPRPVPLPLPGPPLSPEAVARAELDQIAASGMLERGEYKQLHAQLAACIRRYLTGRFDFPAFAMTTTELRRGMEERGVGRWQARLVTGLLTESDAVNFAQYRPAHGRCEQNLEMAYQIVDAGEPVGEPVAAQAQPA